MKDIIFTKMEEQVVEKLVVHEAINFVAKMEPELELPIKLYYGLMGYESHTMSEVAKILGCSTYKAMCLIHTGERRLRWVLERKFKAFRK